MNGEFKEVRISLNINYNNVENNINTPKTKRP